MRVANTLLIPANDRIRTNKTWTEPGKISFSASVCVNVSDLHSEPASILRRDFHHQVPNYPAVRTTCPDKRGAHVNTYRPICCARWAVILRMLRPPEPGDLREMSDEQTSDGGVYRWRPLLEERVASFRFKNHSFEKPTLI